MAAQWGPWRPPLQPPWRKSLGLSSLPEADGGAVGTSAPSSSGCFLVDLSGKRGVCIVADGAVAVPRCHDPRLLPVYTRLGHFGEDLVAVRGSPQGATGKLTLMEGAMGRCPTPPSASTWPWATPSCVITRPPTPSHRLEAAAGQLRRSGLIFSVGNYPAHSVTRNQPNHWFLHEKLATLPSSW